MRFHVSSERMCVSPKSQAGLCKENIERQAVKQVVGDVQLPVYWKGGCKALFGWRASGLSHVWLPFGVGCVKLVIRAAHYLY